MNVWQEFHLEDLVSVWLSSWRENCSERSLPATRSLRNATQGSRKKGENGWSSFSSVTISMCSTTFLGDGSWKLHSKRRSRQKSNWTLPKANKKSGNEEMKWCPALGYLHRWQMRTFEGTSVVGVKYSVFFKNISWNSKIFHRVHSISLCLSQQTPWCNSMGSKNFEVYYYNDSQLHEISWVKNDTEMTFYRKKRWI